ncbi:pirin family protein [Streptomyces phyllanthi]|uniref:Pirin family protein n=1 Tax=Streptomyces phyllanthi TaxID=1803180 RepID=A0A5N8VV34_9ACTN|nr:pirin family protein [Streptomyces phyllanthi]MPY38632.1 pirin family protein [Streptomyces phyllanthi]
MPAITVDDILFLPRLPELDPTATRYRPVRRLGKAERGFEGEGFPVRRAFAGVTLPELDPFVHMDHLGEVEMAPGEPMGTPWHPHRGFETVTYLIDGAVEHQDSNGGGGKLSDGDTQWMTAGAGILHIEQPPEQLVRNGGVLHGVQLWVNLPRAKKMSPPRYQDIRGKHTGLLTTPDGGALIRVIAGDVAGHTGPGVTHSPITVAHLTLEPGAQVDLPWNPAYNALVYALAGHGTVGAEGRPFQEGRLVVFGEGDALRLSADRAQESRAPKLELFVLGGLPIREPVVQYGPFVMNTAQEVQQAFEDYQAGRLGVIPAQHLPHTS